MQKWAGFWLLALIWGSSFALIRIGVDELSPFQLVFIRTAIAAVGLNLVLLMRGKHIPFNLRELMPLIVIGIGNTTIPFALITWGEQSIESGLASVLQSSVPLFALIIAHFALSDERITRQKLIGVLVGFCGILLLSSRTLEDGQVTNSFWGQMAIIGASLFYAIFATYSRKVIQNRFEPLVVSSGAMITAAISSGILMILAPSFGGEAAVPLAEVSSDVLIAVLILGVVNTFIAYLIFYWIIQQLGAARSTMVTYVIPVFGVTLGVVLLNESVDWRFAVGAVLIFSGIAIVNLKFARIIQGLRPHKQPPIASETSA
jgi:drug/metabolite transporter (DMT)-like permease